MNRCLKNRYASRPRTLPKFKDILKLWNQTASSHGPTALKLDRRRIEDAWHVVSVDMGLRLELVLELLSEPFSQAVKLKIKKECRELNREIDFCSKTGLYFILLNHR
jgi:hypothetical protein